MKRLFHVVFLTASLVVSSCTDEGSVLPPASPSPPPNLPDIHFPLTAGSRWVYSTFDSLSQARDTVEVNIPGMTASIYGGKQASIWLYQYRTHLDTLFAVRSEDTVWFYSFSYAPYLWMRFVFPLHIGLAWSDLNTDAVDVRGEDTVFTPAGTFTGCYRIFQGIDKPNNASSYIYWVKPDVGVVRQQRRDYITVGGYPRTNTLWVLISYSIVR